ncbi:hypothetical protein WJX81_006622 [Elliptochloris bilobata]|uniref:Cell cycle checkpoint protein RAD1 n=1 Tax=Elliptochloris bilobata TaxID=381761 RepID=A0AAW1QHZ0_9CHLO
MVSVLQAIKASNTHQLCTVILHADGLSVRWEDESKSLQASVFLRKELFVEYEVPWLRKEFGLQLGLLVDTLHVFTAGTAELVLRYPGANQELICEMTEEGAGGVLCTYASLDSMEVEPPRDLVGFWEGPESFFLVPGAMMKEVIDDMEWGAVSKSVEVLMQRSPPRIVLSSRGIGGLLITLPVGQLTSVQCATPEVRQIYKHKHLKTAFAHLPQSKDASASMGTKVTLDSQGMIKVSHMLSLGGAEARGGHYTSEAAYQDSQRVAEQQRVSMVQFLILPEDAGEDDEL